jgi:hypothetical protein
MVAPVDYCRQRVFVDGEGGVEFENSAAKTGDLAAGAAPTQLRAARDDKTNVRRRGMAARRTNQAGPLWQTRRAEARAVVIILGVEGC